MKEIKTRTIGEAWIKSCKYIMDKGKSMKDGDKNLKEIINLLVFVKTPEQTDAILEKHADKNMTEWMLSNFLDDKRVPELKNALSYGHRLFNYKGKNQVEWIINKLKKKPETKAATISMLMSDDEDYIPCVSVIDFKLRNGRLNITAMCRAIDFGKKVYANLIALNKIQQIVADKIGSKTGSLAMYNISAHIYEEDFIAVNNLLEAAKR